ncbi:hypothetical protein IJ818_04430 [bacterium]|nr:hypothetical protein [bacterium]
MKRFILTIIFILFLIPQADAAQKTLEQQSNTLAVKEIRAVLNEYVQYENSKNMEGIKRLHADDYMTVDAMPKKVYVDIIDKTWKKYTNIKQELKIKNIEVNGNYAIAEVTEILKGSTSELIDDKTVEGTLTSVSNIVYYMRKTQNQWKFVSDYVVDEQTVLAFEKAKELNIEFTAPSRVLAGKEYVATFNVQGIPKDSFVVATIGQEKIIYPHKNAEEVYRKVPQDGILERVFKSNQDNLNEYIVVTYCITKPVLTKTKQIETLLTGVGYIINRVNVVPENKFITVSENGKKETKI